eukprot:4438659-Amphidinium_carterae.2
MRMSYWDLWPCHLSLLFLSTRSCCTQGTDLTVIITPATCVPYQCPGIDPLNCIIGSFPVAAVSYGSVTPQPFIVHLIVTVPFPDLHTAVTALL